MSKFGARTRQSIEVVMVPDLSKYPYFAIDTETDGLKYLRNKAFGVSIALPDQQTFYWDLRREPEIVDQLNSRIAGYKGTIIAHNASFDARMSHTSGIILPLGNLDDTVIRACLLDEHLQDYSLEGLSNYYLAEGKVGDIYEELAYLFGGQATRNSQMPNISRAPAEVVSPYARKDALLAMRLWEKQNKLADEEDSIDRNVPSIRTIWDFERRMMPHFIRMEMHGIAVNREAAERAVVMVDREHQAKAEELKALIGDINVNSSPQIRALFRPELNSGGWHVGPVALQSTKNGGPSLDANAMRALADAGDKRAMLILEVRSLIKTRDTFLSGHILGHEVNGRVYPTVNQTKGEDGGTGTGRLSVQEPALQQIPSRNRVVAAIVKDVFEPDHGEQWLETDESSFEVRVFAHLVSKFDSRIADKYKENPKLDFHQFTADLTGLPRNASYPGQPYAKALTLSQIFNQGPGAAAEKMGMSWEWDEFEAADGNIIRYKKPGDEAKRILEIYHNNLPGIKKLQKAATNTALNRGFIYTKSGRRIRFPGGYKAYKASGLLIQATAADYNKENIMMISEFCAKYGGRLLLNTHDSYSISAPEGWYQDCWPQLRSQLEDANRANVPLLMDVGGMGSTWWRAINNEYNVTK